VGHSILSRYSGFLLKGFVWLGWVSYLPPQLPTNGQFRIGIREQARANILYCIVENHQIEKLLIYYAMTLMNFKNSPKDII
jgi:hypothetical protein